MQELQTARRTGVTTLGLGVLDVSVALYKTTGDSKSATGWETRLVDADGKPYEPDPAAETLTSPRGTITKEQLVGAPVQGDPLGGMEAEPPADDAAADALDDAEDAARAWGDSPPAPVPEVRRQRGFETEHGFIPAEEQLDAIEARTTLDRAQIVGFVRAEQVQRARVVAGYYLAPEGDSVERVTALKTLDMLKAALQRTSRFAVVKFTKKKGQRLGVIAPDRSGALVLLELAWGANLRKPPKGAVLPGNAAAPEEVEACCELIEAMAEPRASLDELEDDGARFRAELRALAEAKHIEDFALPEGPSQGVDERASLIEAMAASADVAEELVARG